jgi:hypothetical protein
MLESQITCRFYVFAKVKTEGIEMKELRALLIRSKKQLVAEGTLAIKVPTLLGDLLMYSPESGILIKSFDVRGLQLEQYHFKARVYLVILWCITCIELYLTINQMEHTSTQSSLSKVSVISLGMMIIQDAYLAITHLIAGIYSRKWMHFIIFLLIIFLIQ